MGAAGGSGSTVLCAGCGRPGLWVLDDLGKWVIVLRGEDCVHKCPAYAREKRRGYAGSEKKNKAAIGLLGDLYGGKKE